MEMRIQTIHFDADVKLLDYAKKRISKLSTFHDSIIDVDVYLKFTAASSAIKEKAVEVKVNVPGNTLFAATKADNFEEAIDMVVETMKRQLKRTKEKVRS
jgi:putative sigma-54 modulation protein